MYSWVYLTDFVAHRQLLDCVASNQVSLRNISELDEEVWKQLKRSAIDPECQINTEGLLLVSALACASSSAAQKPRVVELGSSFGCASIKWSLVKNILGEQDEHDFVGIENSPFMRQVFRLLIGDHASVVCEVQDLERSDGSSLLSRFVASYAFAATDELVEFCNEHFDTLAIEDAFSINGREHKVWNHGQAETFFSLPQFVAGLKSRGFQLGLLSAYPDYPAGTEKTFVAKILAFRHGTPWSEVSNRYQILTGREVHAILDGEELLDQLNLATTEAVWKQVQQAKSISPVWGPTNPSEHRKSNHDHKKALRKLGPWQNYGLTGPLAVEAISRHLEAQSR